MKLFRVLEACGLRGLPSYRAWAGGLLALAVIATPAAAMADGDAPEVQDEQSADPWQAFNRKVFAFNEVVDKYTLRPLAVTYRALMPDPLEVGVRNIFNNVLEVPSILNGTLQGKFGGAAHDSGRLLVNTTLGLGGLLDVAQYMNLPADEREDFGQTLAVWGYESSAYLVLPFLGPSTLRDGLAKPVDWFTNPTSYIDHVPTDNTVLGVSLLNTRAGLLPLEESISGDRYTFIRDAYLQRRAYLINNGEVNDDFGAEDSFELDDF